MPKRTVAEFVEIAQPIIEEYKNSVVEATINFQKSTKEQLADMSESEAVVFYAMLTNAQNEIEKIAEEQPT